MFEKSLVDLIRGLRNHKGREAEYIQTALKECRSEIRSQDMDVKATALLKLIYLEMFGYDMTWAAFNVLEVMSAAKHVQKRVGYLGAVQTFRPETEVLMLAENLLKKDLVSSSIPTLSLPLVTLPHIITSSLALSIISDLLPRLSHSQPHVRKKTIVTLYRLALVYPETLRVAWPKIKEKLLDEQEDSSVTAATVNVICELGWRRPQDFLPLAPRLFDLLIDGGNNWMAIKIIKLFAVLTPLEPRLIKKLVRPLTNLIQTTSAMSLLYECISGIIQGGILGGVEAGVDVEEVADLCISKLRGMIVLEGDPNLKYVALLAFNKIVTSHPALVAMQQDVILSCLDDPDVSIRLQALELASGMVSSDNLQDVVNRLMGQLANAPSHQPAPVNGEDEEQTDLEQKLIPDERGHDMQSVPQEYRQDVVSRILDMCSVNTYSNITDFEWYTDILVRLIRFLPATPDDSQHTGHQADKPTLGGRIGEQILDIAVRVPELRQETVRAAEKLTLVSGRNSLFASHGGGLSEVLRSTGWVCGEFAAHLSSPYDVLNSLIHHSSASMSPETVAIIAQAIPKVFAEVVDAFNREWNASRKSTVALLLARTVEFLEKLSSHPSLEVQERSVEFLELLKLATEALAALPADSLDAPLLLTSAIPNLFTGTKFNPVAASAQSKVPLPDDLDLDAAINPDLETILQASQLADEEDGPTDQAFELWYYERDEQQTSMGVSLQPGTRPTIHQITQTLEEEEPLSYQAPPSPTTVARMQAERTARYQNDPFYIAPGSGATTPGGQIHDIIARSNKDHDLDIDAIPIIDLQIDTSLTNVPSQGASAASTKTTKKKKPRRTFQIQGDETLDVPSSRSGSNQHSQASTPALGTTPPVTRLPSRPARNLLSVDSTSLGSISLADSASTSDGRTQLDFERRLAEEAEMAAALKQIEQKRLELAREEERMRTKYAEGVDEDGVVVKRKKKKSRTAKEDSAPVVDEGGDGVEGRVVKKKKKKRVKDEQAEVLLRAGGEGPDVEGKTVKTKKKAKKREVEVVENSNEVE